MTNDSTQTAIRLDLDSVANELLTLIEFREVGSLAWGFTDIRQDLDRDVEALVSALPVPVAPAWGSLRAAGVAETALLDNLVDRRLIFESGGFYRTRFAETIRLLALLRQRFSDDDWNTGPTLIGDYRLALARRRYPKRNVDGETVLKELRELEVDRRVVDAVAALLVDGKGGQLKLAGFQSEAVIRISGHLKTRQERGVVIGAGTGSGKTKAFYIPALAEVAASLSDTRRVQVIAIYPRNELLKDQFVEAFNEARKLDALPSWRQRRPISIGAYYGDTPYSAASMEKTVNAPSPNQRSFWEFDGHLNGWLCPFFRCPNDDCDRETLLWRRIDVQAEVDANRSLDYGIHEILYCPDCGFVTPAGTVQLTRDSMESHPPDILFTSTETLNRNLANAAMHGLFGINVDRPPRLVLLDEIHTYAGVHGAQVAYLLRRWRYGRTMARETGCCIVGLSATLTQAENFFSRLTGLPEHKIEYIRPDLADMIEEGAEYNVVVKGDPASGASLLSTSIQTAMLMGRMLDPIPANNEPSLSHDAIGQRMFAFTDSLDVINRWYHFAEDAETRQRLSQFRKPNPSWSPVERRQRSDAGQVWWLSEKLGHHLDEPLRLERTSSQDRGVNRTAQLVIATSTLEVGFNDPTVGAVIQHKAPRQLASFLQRKGRGGRRRMMRPWTVVVTSAFGRDRWAFQHSEHLFDPELPPNHLPLDNDYVRKIQASFALMDWLTLTLAKLHKKGNIWELLTNKPNQSANARDYLTNYRAAIVAILDKVLDGTLADSLTMHLAGALELAPNSPAMRGILWSDPRSLMFDLIPTLVRQLRSNWYMFGEGEWKDTPSTHPIPHYVPQSLFSDLNLPQLEIVVPLPSRPQHPREPRTEAMAMSVGMREFAPGHARKRFTERDLHWLAHWLPVNAPDSGDRTVFELGGSAVHTTNVPIAVLPRGDDEVSVYKPLRYELQILPKGIDENSSGRLCWQVCHEIHDEFSASDGETRYPAIEMRPISPLRTFVSAVQYFVHDEGAWARVVRYASSVDMVLKKKFQRGVPRSVVFARDGRPAALGFAIEADAIRFQMKPIDVAALRARGTWPRLYRVLGARFFRDRLLSDERLTEEQVSIFDVDWLWQVELAAITATAIALNLSLEDAAREVDKNRLRTIERTLQVIFQTQRDEAGEETEEYGRRYQELMQLEEKVDVIKALQEHRTVLWDDAHPDLDIWLEERHRASLASALMTAIIRFVPETDPEDLHFDVEGANVWISEASPGGVGIVSRVVREIHDKPRRFDLAFLDAIENCEREQISNQLHRISYLLQIPHHPLIDLFRNVRQSRDLTTIERLTQDLTHALETEGIATNRALFVAINSKFLRPNSGLDSDDLVAKLVKRWDEEATRLGIHIDLRTIAVTATKLEEIADTLGDLLGRVGSREVSANLQFNLLQSLLWEGCADSCPACIQLGHLYADAGYVSRHLLTTQLESAFVQVVFGEQNWQARLREHLVKHLEVRLVCGQDRLTLCTEAVLELLIEPVDLDYQLAHAAIDRITRDGTTWILHLVIPDLIES